MRAHYEKVICGCCLLLLFTNVGLASTSFNVYQPHIVAIVGDENGSNVLLLRTFVSLVCMMFVGKWYKLLNCRVGASLAGCLAAAGFFAYSFATDLAGFFCGAVLTGAGYGLGGMVACTMLINRWYKAKVGTALGVVAAGSSIAGIIMPVVSTFFINTLGLGWSFRFEAILALALTTACFALLRNDPADLGLAPYGSAVAQRPIKATTQAPASARAGRVARVQRPIKVATKTPHAEEPQAGMLSSQAEAESAPAREYRGAQEPLSSHKRMALWIAMVFMGCVAVDSWNYLSVLMTHANFDTYFVATLLSVAAVAMLVGKLATGALFDKIGTVRASILFFSFLIAGLILCTLADLGSELLMVAGVLLLGFGVSLGTVGISVWSIDLSTPLERAKLIKDLQVAYACGGFLFNLVPGRIVEAGGSYTMSYVLLALMCAAEAAIVISICRSTKAAG